MSEYPKEIEGIVVNNAQEEEIAKEELARAKIKLQIKNKKTFAKVQVAREQMKESINRLNDKEESIKNFNDRFKLEQEQKEKRKFESELLTPRGQLVTRLVEKYGVSRKKAQSYINTFFSVWVAIFFMFCIAIAIAI